MLSRRVIFAMPKSVSIQPELNQLFPLTGDGGDADADALPAPQFGCQIFFYFWRSEKCGAASQAASLLSLLLKLEFLRTGEL